MGRESLRGNISVLQLPKCPFVDDIGVSSVVENAGGDPRLHMMKPGALSIHRYRKRRLKRTSSTSHPPRLTPRTFCDPYGKLGLNDRAAGRKPARARRIVGAVNVNISGSGYSPGMRRKSPRHKTRRGRMPSYYSQTRPRGRRLEKAKIAQMLELERS
jgi:hypothetical protein